MLPMPKYLWNALLTGYSLRSISIGRRFGGRASSSWASRQRVNFLELSAFFARENCSLELVENETHRGTDFRRACTLCIR
jgi:hypothetical protein